MCLGDESVIKNLYTDHPMDGANGGTAGTYPTLCKCLRLVGTVRNSLALDIFFFFYF